MHADIDLTKHVETVLAAMECCCHDHMIPIAHMQVHVFVNTYVNLPI